MIVPVHWAESSVTFQSGGKSVTIRRFGWSDASLEEAQARAGERAEEAKNRVLSGERVDRRERKVSYNGADGVPIREEILSRHGDAVVTRNIYGARCLNSPGVLFADIDFPTGPGGKLSFWMILPPVAAALGLGFWYHISCGAFFLLAIVAGLTGSGLAKIVHRAAQILGGGPERIARSRLERFVRRRPDWHLRLYRTPAGLRVLAMHRTFDPLDAAVEECFRSFGTDPIYARMCRRQRCFRARVSPKPWRIGIAAHLKPRPGVWPINPERLPDRAKWVEEYEAASVGYASCRFVGTLGSSVVDLAVKEVQELHDDLSRAGESLPIA